MEQMSTIAKNVGPFTFSFILVPRADTLFHVLTYCIPDIEIRIRFALNLNKNSLVSYQRHTSGHNAHIMEHFGILLPCLIYYNIHNSGEKNWVEFFLI
jgi:hypothetical protein